MATLFVQPSITSEPRHWSALLDSSHSAASSNATLATMVQHDALAKSQTLPTIDEPALQDVPRAWSHNAGDDR
jgi:hypothetical protein